MGDMNDIHDDRFEKALRDMSKAYHQPPETPREEMWAYIQARRQERAQGRRSRWWAMGALGVAAAAVLTIGVSIGRFSAREEVMPPPDAVAAADDSAQASELYRFAATQHLQQVESYLTMFRMDATIGRPITDADLSASELLSTTRLFLDSPASEDARMRDLLQDIELVLVQIAQLARGDEEELTLIDESIEQQGVMLRLQSALGADALTGAQGAL